VFVIPTWDTASLFSGQGADSTIVDYQDTYHLAGSLTRFIGNHTVKFGAEFTINKFNYAQTNTSSGLWNFSGSQTSNSSISANQVFERRSGYRLVLPGLSHQRRLLVFRFDRFQGELSGRLSSPTTGASRPSSPSTLAPVGKTSYRSLSATNRLSLFDRTASNDALTAAGFPGVKGNVELVATPEHPRPLRRQP